MKLSVEYRKIEGASGYMIGSDGSFWSCKTYGPGPDGSEMKKLKPWRDGQGYEYVQIYLDSKAKIKRAVHRLVLEAFVGAKPSGFVARHLNGCPFDNRLENLSWGTAKENAQDRKRHGRDCRGERQHSSKLKESDVCEIKKLTASGVSSRKLAKSFGISKQSVLAIARGRNWRWMFDYEKTQKQVELA